MSLFGKKSNPIHVLLVGGTSDHYIVQTEMNAREVQQEGERYVRTQETRLVDEKDGTHSYRVYQHQG